MMSVPAELRARCAGHWSLTAALLVGCLLPATLSHAQIGASVEGVVQDESGGTIGKATVQARNVDTGQVRSAVADAEGRYQIFGLGPSEQYEVRVAADGFRPDVRMLSSITAGERRVQDFRLAVGAVTDRVDVVSELPLARTGTPALGGTLSEAQVEQLPVNGRDLISLAYLIPGAAPARGFYNLAPRLTINGSSSLVTNYTVDGFDNTDLFLGGPKVPVTIGSTQNLAVMVNSYSAEYGRTGNGVFAVTTKSGGQRHGGRVVLLRASGQQHRLTELSSRPRTRTARSSTTASSATSSAARIGGPLADAHVLLRQRRDDARVAGRDSDLAAGGRPGADELSQSDR